MALASTVTCNNKLSRKCMEKSYIIKHNIETAELSSDEDTSNTEQNMSCVNIPNMQC